MGIEYDAGATWAVLGEVVREALERAPAAPEAILGIAATSMRHASALLDADGSELLLTSNHDARGLAEALGLAGACGEELHRRTGHWPNPVQAAGRLLHLVPRDPGDLRAGRDAPEPQRLARLSPLRRARLPTPPRRARRCSSTSRPAWAWDLIERLELPRPLFPAIRDAGSPLGELARAAAADLGLRAGIPVAVGGGDTQCGLLGAGVVAPGQLGIVAGTSAPVQLVLRPAAARRRGSPVVRASRHARALGSREQRRRHGQGARVDRGPSLPRRRPTRSSTSSPRPPPRSRARRAWSPRSAPR